MDMVMVTRCDATECAYNMGDSCHAMAITIGGKTDRKCDTFLSSSAKGGIPDVTAGVGACKVSICTYNKNLECVPGHSSGPPGRRDRLSDLQRSVRDCERKWGTIPSCQRLETCPTAIANKRLRQATSVVCRGCRDRQHGYSGASSRTSRLICLNSGVPATRHHSNRAASVVVSVAPDESIRPSAVR